MAEHESNPISDGIIAINGRIIADRLDVAHRREAEYESALKAERDALREQYEAGALVDGARGDCAKLREALEVIRAAHAKRETPHDILVCRIIDDALGAEGGAK